MLNSCWSNSTLFNFIKVANFLKNSTLCISRAYINAYVFIITHYVFFFNLSIFLFKRNIRIKELKDKCKSYQVVYLNGTRNIGIWITGPNGNKILLPAGGSYKNGGKQNVDKYGDYWAGKPHPDDDRCAYVFFYHQYSGGLDNTDGARCNGCNIRPVTK